MTLLRSEGSGDASTGFYPEEIDQSLRFNDGDSPYLSRTFGTATSTTQGTWSCWFKRGDTNARGILWSASNYEFIDIQASGQIVVPYLSNLGYVYTNGRFRDPTNWYNLVVTFDTPNATEADRLRIYVNGVRQEVYDSITLTQNATFQRWNVSGYTGHIGNFQYNNTLYFDGFLAECNWIDGTALEPSSFGETKNGVWIPKAISGLTYGNNGFRLTFADSSSLGDDTSGNTNDFSSSGLASTDVVTDSPSNNFATYNPLYVDADSKPTLSEGNLRADGTSSSWFNSLSTFTQSSGKWYAEFDVTNYGTGSFIAIATAPSTSTYFGSDTNAYGYHSSGQIFHNGSASAYGDSWTGGGIIGVALDLDGGNVYFYKDGAIQNSGTAAVTGLTGEWTIGVSISGSTGEIRANFGQDATFQGDKTSGSDDASDSNGQGTFYETPPSGYLALCSSNLSDTTISPNKSEQADDNFNTVLYTGDGNTTQSIDIGFNPDWVWIKSRSSNTGHHSLIDSLRGDVALNSNQTIAEYSVSEFNINTDNTIDVVYYNNDYSMNTNTATYVAWNWKAGEAPTADNSASAGAIATAGSVKIDGSNKSDAMAGTIAVTRLSASTESGISIITYTGSGANGTLPHGLTSAPEMIFFKKRDTNTSWMVYNKTNGNNRFLYLDLNNAQTGTDSTYFNNTDPSSTVISLGTYHRNNSSTKTYVAYAFHSVEGYSKIGSYTGNSSTDGTFVYTGFRPAWILIKNITATGQWFMLDNKRLGYNESNYRLLADDVLQEYSGSSSNILNIFSNGFKLKQTSSNYNTSNTYIYMAFAEQPFKFSNAR